MKVTPQNTAYIIAVAIIYTVILACVNILDLLLYHPLRGMTSYKTELLTTCAYLVCTWYMGDLLKYIGEPKPISTAFYIYICLTLLAALAFLLAGHGRAAIYIRAGFNFAAFFAKVYFIVQLFRIKNQAFVKYFSALAGSILIAMFLKLVEDLLKIQHWTRDFINPIVFVSVLLPALVIVFTLYKIYGYLKHEQQAFKQASLSSDEPA